MSAQPTPMRAQPTSASSIASPSVARAFNPCAPDSNEQVSNLDGWFHADPKDRPSLRIAVALPGLHRVVRGAETAFEQIACGLAMLGHRVTVFGSGPPRPAPYRYCRIRCIPRERFENFPRLPILRSHYAWEEATFSLGLLRRFDPRDFDVTLACSYPFMNWMLRRRSGEHRPCHVFVTENGDWMVRGENAEYRYFNCDGLVCTNPQYFERHRKRYPSALIPNGVDPNLYHPGAGDRARFGLPGGRPIALMVSALIPSKHVEEGVKAVARIPDLFLAIAGDGPCRSEVDALAAHLLPGRYSRFTLPRQQMPELYRCADVFLHASRDEPSANAYLEALASGLPIVAHDWEVTRWTLENTAFLVDAADPAAMAAGLGAALAARSEADVAARRDLIQRRFDWDTLVRQYSEFLHEIRMTPSQRA